MSTLYPNTRSSAVEDFKKLRRQAALQQILARFTGKSAALLSFGEVTQALKMVGEMERGLQTIPVSSIVGSVGRYDDFTRSFLPRKAFDMERWTNVRLAAQQSAELPPINVYQIGDAYFVLDGNHRVSIARQMGQEYISAVVTEVLTRAPLSPDDQPDALIIKAEYAAFLEQTGLDRLRPEVNLLVTAPGQYRMLEDLIEIHRYCTETTEQCDLNNQVAVMRWYDEAYVPVVEAIREQGILGYFPGRTETDLYIWLMQNQAELRETLGWEMRPEALARLAEHYQSKSGTLPGRLFQRLRSLVAPETAQHPAAASTQETLLLPGVAPERNTDRAFTAVLVAVEPTAPAWSALDQAVQIAKKESATLYGLCVAQEADRGRTEELAQLFLKRCQEADVEGQFGMEMGALSERISARGLLADLVVLNCGLGAGPEESELFTREIEQVLRRCARPTLVVPGTAIPSQRVLLAFDDRAADSASRSRAALYLAAYLANQWGTELQVLVVLSRGQSAVDATAFARQYLEEQGVDAEITVCGGDVAQTIVQTAQSQGSDLIVMGSYSRGWLSEHLRGNVVNRVLAEATLPVLVCP